MSTENIDPYYEIKQEIERELTQVHKLQRALYAGQSFAADAVSRTLDSIQEQLVALEEAVQHMVAKPEKFSMTATIAYTRQVEVENLRYEMQDLRRTFNNHIASQQQQHRRPHDTPTQRSSDQYHHKTSPTSGHHDQSAVRYYQSKMQQTMQQQDEELDHISMHVGNIAQAGLVMHEELEEQTRLLGGLEGDVDSQQAKISGLRRRTNDLLQKVSKDSQLKLIVLLSIVLFVLVLLAFF